MAYGGTSWTREGARDAILELARRGALAEAWSPQARAAALEARRRAHAVLSTVANVSDPHYDRASNSSVIRVTPKHGDYEDDQERDWASHHIRILSSGKVWSETPDGEPTEHPDISAAARGIYDALPKVPNRYASMNARGRAMKAHNTRLHRGGT